MRKKKQDTNDALREHAVPDVVVADDRTEKKQRHIFAKLLCLISATVVWLYAMNLESTDYQRVFTSVPVVVDGVTQLNAAGDMSVIAGYGSIVDVVVSGKKSDVQDLTVDDIRASVDVSTLHTAGKYPLPVTVQLPAGFVAVDAEKLTAEVYVDVNTTREIPVRITNLDYVISSSYTMGEPILSHTTVTVTGPAQVLELIDCAALEFDLGNVTTSTTMVGSPSLVDIDGVRLSNPYVRCDIREITAEIPVSTIKELKLVASYQVPELRSGWMAEITPKTVLVEGDPMILNSLEQIAVYEIAVGVREGEYIVGAGVIDLPQGVSVVNAPSSITVRVNKILG